jgi:hypothetical protein
MTDRCAFRARPVGRPRRAAAGRIDPPHAGAGRGLRGAGLPPLLAQRTPRPADARGHGARGADGGGRGAHRAHPHRQRGRHAAALLAVQGRRAVPRAGCAGARPHRPGRGPRARQRPAHRALLNRDLRLGRNFPQQVLELKAWVSGEELPPGHPGHGVQALPTGPPAPQLWMLGSSGYGAQLAGALRHAVRLRPLHHRRRRLRPGAGPVPLHLPARLLDKPQAVGLRVGPGCRDRAGGLAPVQEPRARPHRPAQRQVRPLAAARRGRAPVRLGRADRAAAAARARHRRQRAAGARQAARIGGPAPGRRAGARHLGLGPGRAARSYELLAGAFELA